MDPSHPQDKEVKKTDNELRELPETIGYLRQLQSLDLERNQLTRLPEAIAQLKELQRLDLSGNQLIELPQSLQSVASLQELYLHDNAGLNLPPEVLGPKWGEKYQSPALHPAIPREILDYYLRTRGGRRPLNEAKLILVGYGDVGKTSLVNRLVHS